MENEWTKKLEELEVENKRLKAYEQKTKRLEMIIADYSLWLKANYKTMEIIVEMLGSNKVKGGEKRWTVTK
jgi:hypothetical protein